MATITPNYTDTGTAVVAAATVANGANTRGTIDLRGKFGTWLMMRIGRLGTTVPGAAIDVKVRRTLNNNGIAHPGDAVARQGGTVAPTSVALTANSSIGDTTLTATAWTGIANGDVVYIGGNAGTPSNEEYARVSKAAGATLTLDAPLKKAHTSGDTVVNKADVFSPVWLAGGSVYEVLCDYGSTGSGSSVRFEALATTYDSDAGA